MIRLIHLDTHLIKKQELGEENLIAASWLSIHYVIQRDRISVRTSVPFILQTQVLHLNNRQEPNRTKQPHPRRVLGQLALGMADCCGRTDSEYCTSKASGCA